MASILPLMIVVFLLPYLEGRCPDRCGSISIPYPFGMGPSCSLEASFDVKCDFSHHPPRAYLATRERVQIIAITPLQIRVKIFNLMFATYQLDGGRIDATEFSINFYNTAFSFSEDNWFTMIGCDDTSLVTGYVNNRTFVSGCNSFCPDRNLSGGLASCPYSDHGLGIGCCRASIPKGTTVLRIDLVDAHKYLRETRIFNGSYALVGEKASNEYTEAQHPLSDLNLNETMFMHHSWAVKHMQKVVLDWRITGAKNCSEAMNNPDTFACQGHTECVDFQTDTPGYLCKCWEGYYGNPYLESALGCQTVDRSMTSPSNSHRAAAAGSIKRDGVSFVIDSLFISCFLIISLLY